MIRRHADQLKPNSLDPREQIRPSADEQWLPVPDSTHAPQETDRDIPLVSGILQSATDRTIID